MRSGAGRAVVVALVAVLLMSVVGLAASQTFINKSGKTVTGIRITFSKSVMITRHDSAFPDQSPSGRSDEFTFSGRDLRNSGRFAISWMPSSGKLTNYEWIEKSQPAQTSQAPSPSSEQEFKLPDPNTPPILYGDDYPDPDEPLYQSQPDEQIWLTDLDRHEDIYDNDSIKINYGPGFNKSQITKIDAYRNGIKLRFLPNTLDVLTNAQMKTFDGNSAEHSPASNHTDHAIMGYEYKVEIHTADHVWMFTKTVKSGFRWQPKEVWAEIDGGWTESLAELTHDDMVEFFHKLKAGGITGISVDMTYYMNSPYDSYVFKLKTEDPDVLMWYTRTQTLDELDTLLKAVRESGLDAHVRSVILISKKYQDEHGFAWSSMIEPRDPRAFFDTYTGLLLELMPILNKYHVKLFTPFQEMDGIEKDTDLVKATYTKLDNVFDGELGFEELTAGMLQGYSPVEDDWKTFEQVVPNFTFWNWEDSQGKPMRIEYSGWTPDVETQKDQRASVMAQNYVKFWLPAVNYYSSKYPANLQMFGEVGAKNADGQSLGANKYYAIPANKMVYDEQEMADFFYAMLKGSKELHIYMLNIWTLPLGDLWANEEGRGGHQPGDFFINIGLRNKLLPVFRVLSSIITPDE